MRNIGLPIGYSVIAFHSLLKGLSKLIVNTDKIYDDLNNNWVVIAEAIQTVLRRVGYAKPYEALLNLTRTNEKITKETISSFIESLDVDEEIKEELRSISPFNYTGY